MLGQLLSAGADFISGITNNMFANYRQNDAQAFSAEQFATRYQTTVKDLEAAGLNPALAYQQGGGNAPTSSAAGAAGMPAPGASFQQARIASAQEANLLAQARKSNAEANITEQVGLDQAKAELSKTLSTSGLNSAQIVKVQADTDNAIASLSNIKDEGQRIRAAAALLYEQSNSAYQQQLSEIQKRELMVAQAKLIVAQAGLANLDLDAAKAFENLGREAGQLKPIIDIFKTLVGVVNSRR